MAKSTPPGNSSSSTPLLRSNAAALLQEIFADGERKHLVATLRSKGEVYLVGGGVRDVLLGKPLKDLDLTTSLPPVEVQKLLEGKFRVIETGMEHGTLTILADGEPVEVTTFRKPSARDHSLFGETIEEDLSGRDFTINAIAFSIHDGVFIDPFHGMADLESSVLCAVGDPTERFAEDPLRLLRMIRFGPAQGRTIHEQTEEAAQKLAEQIHDVAVERIREELVGILVSPFPHEGVRSLHETGLLSAVLPELLPAVGCEQNEWHIHDVFDHTLWVLERSENEKLVRLAALFHDIGKPATLTVDDKGRRHFYYHERIGAEMTKSVLERLRFSKSETKIVTQLVRQHMRPLHCGPSGVRRILRDLGDQFERWLLIKRADAPPVQPEEEFERDYAEFLEMVRTERERSAGPAYGKLALTGKDLLELGVKEGPLVGALLAKCEEAVIEDPDRNTREGLLAIVEESLEQEASP